MIYNRNEAELVRILKITEFQAADYSPSGHTRIIERLERITDSPWADKILMRERAARTDAFVCEQAERRKRDADIILAIKAAARFGGLRHAA